MKRNDRKRMSLDTAEKEENMQDDPEDWGGGEVQTHGHQQQK